MGVLTDRTARLSTDLDWYEMYSRNIATARGAAEKMPLIHVSGHYTSFLQIVSVPPHEIPTSEESAGYCSDHTRAAEDVLKLSRSVYFYAGRAHPDFGSVALAFGPECEATHSGSVTPFDTGGLFGKFIKWKLPDYDPPTLQRFMSDSVIDLAKWRSDFADYIAMYFDPLTEYWFGRPCKIDPEGMFQAGNEWRAWVFEVRFHEGQRIQDALAWCASPESAALMFEEVENLSPLGADPHPLEGFLRGVRSLVPAGTPHYCSEIEGWVRDRVGL